MTWFDHDVCARWAMLSGARRAPPQANWQSGLMVSSETEQSVVSIRLISLRPNVGVVAVCQRWGDISSVNRNPACKWAHIVTGRRHQGSSPRTHVLRPWQRACACMALRGKRDCAMPAHLESEAITTTAIGWTGHHQLFQSAVGSISDQISRDTAWPLVDVA